MNLSTKIMYVVLLILAVGIILTVVSIWLSSFFINITKFNMRSKKIPKSFDNYKILQISDLHNKEFSKNNSRLLKKIDEIKPDIIVLTGDMVSANSKDFALFFSLVDKLTNIYPVYYVFGNHEIKMDSQKQIKLIEQINNSKLIFLRNEKIEITKDDKTISLFGLEQPFKFYKNLLRKDKNVDFLLSDMEKIFSNINNEGFNILLSHSPFDFEVFAKWGADLTLSGHVHGGLIRLPFIGGLISPERGLFPKYSEGEYSIDDSKMIVSRGLGGSSGVNLRLFNNPEICVVTLKCD